MDENKKNSLFSRLKISDIGDGTRWDSLSGGEQIKTAIALAFLKDTPYVFLDEPTNHLDNASTEALIGIIEEEAKEKTIVIVSHDSRLQPENQKEIRIEEGKIIQEATETIQMIIF